MARRRPLSSPWPRVGTATFSTASSSAARWRRKRRGLRVINDKDVLAPARDEFERYYIEKIWDWIPAIYKDEDGLAARPDVLRSLEQILARQSAIARRSIDRLWDDQFIELCDD